MPYNFVAGSFQSKKLCSEVQFWTVNRGLGILSPFGELRGNVRCLSQAHWKTRSGLPISVTWTFFATCYGWGATVAKIHKKIGDFAPTLSVWPKISSRRGLFPFLFPSPSPLLYFVLTVPRRSRPPPLPFLSFPLPYLLSSPISYSSLPSTFAFAPLLRCGLP